MTPDDVRKMIRRFMSGKKSVPTKQIRHHVLFKHKCLGKHGFALQWEDVIRLNKQQDSCWLVCGDSREDDFTVFVLPHTVGMKLIEDDPMRCYPYGQGELRAAKQNVNFNANRYALTALGRNVCMKEFENNADYFEEWVADYWELRNKTDRDSGIHFSACPRCDRPKLPNYGTDHHDYRCGNGKCHLWWRGNWWSDRKGFWIFNGVDQKWIPWDGKPLDDPEMDPDEIPF